jgi:Fic family protein
VDTKNFKKPNGKIISINRDNKKYVVFIPNKLPISINYTNTLIKKIEQSNNNLGKLSGLIKTLPNADLILKPYLKNEAVLSSKIEGTRSSLSDVLRADLINKNPTEDLKEVLNYINALNEGLEKIKSEKISLELILRLNKILLLDVRGFSKDSGKLRIVQNWIGYSNSDLETSIYNPPNPENLLELMNNFLTYLNTDDDTPFLIKIAILHYQFESIHPFVDGNGRVGRLLIILYLCKCNLLEKPILYLSEYFEKEKENYYQYLLNASSNSEINNWIEYFLDGVIDQSKKTIKKITKLLEYRSITRAYLKDNNVSVKLLIIFDSLFSNPYITVSKGKDILNTKNYNTSKRVINKLVDLNILTKTTDGLFLAKEIQNILLSK